jgi:hypothetical protein
VFFSEVRSKPKVKITGDKIAGATFLLFALAGCQTKAPGPPPRYAVLRFENLSGDASLEFRLGTLQNVSTRCDFYAGFDAGGNRQRGANSTRRHVGSDECLYHKWMQRQ